MDTFDTVTLAMHGNTAGGAIASFVAMAIDFFGTGDGDTLTFPTAHWTSEAVAAAERTLAAANLDDGSTVYLEYVSPDTVRLSFHGVDWD